MPRTCGSHAVMQLTTNSPSPAFGGRNERRKKMRTAFCASTSARMVHYATYTTARGHGVGASSQEPARLGKSFR